jgi:hypothetical protein
VARNLTWSKKSWLLFTVALSLSLLLAVTYANRSMVVWPPWQTWFQCVWTWGIYPMLWPRSIWNMIIN